MSIFGFDKYVICMQQVVFRKSILVFETVIPKQNTTSVEIYQFSKIFKKYHRGSYSSFFMIWEEVRIELISPLK